MTTPPAKEALLATLDRTVQETLAYFEGAGRTTDARVDRWQARDVLMHGTPPNWRPHSGWRK